MFCEEFNALVNTPIWKDRFIGYGNPDARILIVGQEAADLEGSDNWTKFYKPNWTQWKETINMPQLEIKDGHETDLDHYFFPEFFSPSFPYYKQEFKRRKTSDTYYWYQVLINHFYEHNGDNILGRPCKIIDFFKHAFITELNEQTRPNHNTKQNVRENIRARFDLMMTAKPFWSHFDVIVFACGPYANALRNDPNLYQAIFGDTDCVYCGQLSGNDAKKSIERIAPIITNTLNKFR